MGLTPLGSLLGGCLAGALGLRTSLLLTAVTLALSPLFMARSPSPVWEGISPVRRATPTADFRPTRRPEGGGRQLPSVHEHAGRPLRASPLAAEVRRRSDCGRPLCDRSTGGSSRTSHRPSPAEPGPAR
jgi:hypothetical protein